MGELANKFSQLIVTYIYMKDCDYFIYDLFIC